MKLATKLLAVVCTLAMLLAMLAVPASAFTGSTATLPATFELIEDFEGGITGTGTKEWQMVGTSTFAESSDYGYGTEGNSLKVDLVSGWAGVKSMLHASTVVNDGLAMWMYTNG